MKKHLLIFIIIAINILISFFISADYGESWDEENMRSYAATTLTAYKNILHPEKMQNFYDNEDDRRYYGPAYMMACNTLVDFLKPEVNQSANTIYHFLNFLIFQVGIFFLYLINKRFFPTPVAIGNTLIFNFQPLFWGHAFINPKDIPIMVFFICAFEAGLNLVSAIPQVDFKKKDQSTSKLCWKFDLQTLANSIKSAKTTIIQAALLISAIIVVYSLNIHKTLVTTTLTYAFGNPDSIPGLIFQNLAKNRQIIPLDLYIAKATTLLNNFGLLLLILLFVIPLLRIISYTYPDQIHQIFITAKNKSHTYINGISDSIKSARFWKESLKYFFISLLETSKKWQFWAAALTLGLVSSTRLNGPYVGLVISLFLLLRNPKKALPVIFLYAIVSFLTMYLLWPYLWGDPFGRFFEAVTYMSNFPWNETVLFDGIRYKVNHLPSIYLPRLILAQLTEAAILAMSAGVVLGIIKILKKDINWKLIVLIVLWTFIPLVGLIYLHIRLYDNFRHIFFLIPPLFLLAGVAINAIYEKTKFPVYIAVVLLLISPGIYSILTLHPYEYVYYNLTLDGLDGVKDKYELDYFGTSLKEATEFVNKNSPTGSIVHVNAPMHLVVTYARPDLVLTTNNQKDTGINEEYTINLNRFYWGKRIFPDDVDLFNVTKEGAIFSSVRKVR